MRSTESSGQEGVAVMIAVMAMALLAALGTGLVLVTTVDARITGNFRAGVEARYAAASMAEWARAHLSRETGWDNVLGGAVRSAFADGLPVGERVLAGGTRVSLSRVVNLARCGRPTTCSTAEMNESTSRRPWGANNPHWQAYAYGPYETLTGSLPGPLSSMYVIALVGDDGLETDGDPLRDGGSADNPGAGVLLIRAVAFGASGAYAAIETTVARQDGGGVRVLSWRQL